MDRLPRPTRSSIRQRRLARWHGRRISDLRPRRGARRYSSVVPSQQSRACGSELGDLWPLAKRMEYESLADSNRCLLPSDLLMLAAAETRFLAGVPTLSNLTYPELM